MNEAVVTLTNEKGLHARPAGQIMDMVQKAKADLTIAYDGQQADASSIMDLLLLAAPQGAELKLIATGREAESLIGRITQLIERDFGE